MWHQLPLCLLEAATDKFHYELTGHAKSLDAIIASGRGTFNQLAADHLQLAAAAVASHAAELQLEDDFKCEAAVACIKSALAELHALQQLFGGVQQQQQGA